MKRDNRSSFFFLQQLWKVPMLSVFVVMVLIFGFKTLATPAEVDRYAVVTAVGVDLAENSGGSAEETEDAEAGSGAEAGESEFEISLLMFVPVAEQSFTEKYEMITSRGKNIAEALDFAGLKVGKEIGLSHIKFIVLSDALLDEDISLHLDYLIRNIHLASSAKLIVTDSSAKEFVSAAQKLDSDSSIKVSEIVNFNNDYIIAVDSSMETFFKGTYGPTRVGLMSLLSLEEESSGGSGGGSEKSNQGANDVLGGVTLDGDSNSSGNSSGGSSGGSGNSGASGGSSGGSGDLSSAGGSGGGSEKSNQGANDVLGGVTLDGDSNSSGNSSGGSRGGSSSGSGENSSGGSGNSSGTKSIVNDGKTLVCKDGVEVLRLSGEQLKGINLLTGKYQTGSIEVEDFSDGEFENVDLIFEIYGHSNTIKVVYENSIPIINVDMALTLRLSEIDGSSPHVNVERFVFTPQICEAIEKSVKKSMQQGLEIMRSSKADIADFYTILYNAGKAKFQNFLSSLDDQEDYLNHIAFKASVRVHGK